MTIQIEIESWLFISSHQKWNLVICFKRNNFVCLMISVGQLVLQGLGLCSEAPRFSVVVHPSHPSTKYFAVRYGCHVDDSVLAPIPEEIRSVLMLQTGLFRLCRELALMPNSVVQSKMCWDFETEKDISWSKIIHPISLNKCRLFFLPFKLYLFLVLIQRMNKCVILLLVEIDFSTYSVMSRSHALWQLNNWFN